MPNRTPGGSTRLDSTEARRIIREYLRIRGFDKDRPTKAVFKARTDSSASVNLDDLLGVFATIFPNLHDSEIRAMRMLLTEALRESLARGYTVRLKGLCKLTPYRTSARKYNCPKTQKAVRTSGKLKARMAISANAFED